MFCVVMFCFPLCLCDLLRIFQIIFHLPAPCQQQRWLSRTTHTFSSFASRFSSASSSRSSRASSSSSADQTIRLPVLRHIFSSHLHHPAHQSSGPYHRTSRGDHSLCSRSHRTLCYEQLARPVHRRRHKGSRFYSWRCLKLLFVLLLFLEFFIASRAGSLELLDCCRHCLLMGGSS